jgi:hypothetical protein
LPRILDIAPDFWATANTSGMTATAFRVFLVIFGDGVLHNYSRATSTEQRAWRITRDALVPSR